MAKRNRESLYFGVFADPDMSTAYVAVLATSAKIALENVQRQFPECESIISERDFDPKQYSDELLRIRAENQSEFDDF